MAAGLGFKTFTTGEVLTAADTNGYLMQGVLVFASSAARAAAITSPQEGQYSYLKDTNSTEYYDGAAWIAAPIGDITGVTAGTGISGGGTSGTVTITNSMATEITAKGDLIAGTGSATFDNLPVGTNGQTLVADSTASTGLKWATPAVASSGLTLITRAAFSAVATTGTTFDGVFSSSYFDYLIVVDYIFSSVNDTEVQIQARYAGPTTQTTDYYGITRRLNFAGSVTDFASSAGSSFTLGKTGDALSGCLAGQYHVSQVGNASEQFKMQGVATDGASIGSDLFGGKIQNSRTYTGFLLKMSSGNITGQVSVYGLAK